MGQPHAAATPPTPGAGRIAPVSVPVTEQPHIAQSFDCTACADAAFVPCARDASLLYRDLGLRAATGGLMRADHIRATGPQAGTSDGWQWHAADFEFIFVLQGQLSFTTPTGETAILHAGDCAHLPAFLPYGQFRFAPGTEMVEISAPADAMPHAGRDTAPPPAERPGRVNAFALSHDGPDAYTVGDGPRKFLAYRDAAATRATGRRVNINVVRNSKAGDSSTGWHYHTLSAQFVFVLQGWSRVEVEGRGEFTLRAADAMTIPHGLKHDVTGFSEDFAVLELNIPADYDTVACDPPTLPAA